jgi:catechol 2,3-dioxygenase-like lactoylglutathione lyase family enzyme
MRRAVINGAHVILFAEDAEAARAFFRDVLGLRSEDAGGGWLIFALPPAEVACHPASGTSHELYLMCDDIDSTVAELEAKGVEFTQQVSDAGFGRLTRMKVPGAGDVGLYEPRHPTPLDL